MVCLGNICRSPTAEGVLLQKLSEAGLSEAVVVDSAGTGDWHIGQNPDKRAQAHALARGYDISALRARQITPQDFERFDFVLAMDHKNLATLRALCPPARQGRIKLLMDFAPAAAPADIADPFFGEAADFEHVIDCCERASAGLIETLAECVDAAPKKSQA